ncbi:hypothetical protein V1508DRAFT_414333 [Lipomyces doorenjongii]|uniref:uncharacterized protein n=1 Tax=Lipomyces doorenjongii TaxID=383834 RepID=UPI0034CD1820
MLLSVKILMNTTRPIVVTSHSHPLRLQRIGISRFGSQYYSDYVMSLVYAEPDPQSARARRASRSVAPTTPPSDKSQRSHRKLPRNATRVTAKRKAMGNKPAIQVRE